ncbi:MAG: glycosyltransferase family 2 protein [Candidatus Bathyarchaeota archaeon]|nr:MAG: glycosyltransferase family 2 protein [Candidatus Bathyarchaeota archaeon]
MLKSQVLEPIGENGNLSITALIPAYNEGESIGNVVRKVGDQVDRVVVINDFSSDETPLIAQYLGATVLNHSRNLGVGAAMQTGINYSKATRPDIVVTLDGDGQHKPEDIPRIIQPILSGDADLVLGSRFLRGSPDMPFIKLLGNKFFVYLIRFLTGTKLTDTQTGFRALNLRALANLDLKANYTYVQEMIIDLCVKGFRIVEVPITVLPRKHGSSKVALNIFNYAIRALSIIIYAYVKKIHPNNHVKKQ